MQSVDTIEENTLSFLASVKILCVEDDKTTQLLYQAFLEDMVGELIFAKDGKEGYEKYSSMQIDLIFTDYDMPVCNGLEFTQKIRLEDEDIPILFVSAIEDIKIVVKALDLNVNNFIQKPLNQITVLNGLVKAVKVLIANRYLEEQKTKESYQIYQEDLAFAKELNILRNDFYYQMIDTKGVSLIDFLYKPLDVISGDAYTARRISENQTFYVLVDGMGKGLSASLTGMIMTSFINHIVDKMIEFDSFSLEILIQESIDYIKVILLDEEAVSIDYILFDHYFHKLRYAKFAMPPFLLQSKDTSVQKIKSNNPPLSKWQRGYNVDEVDIRNITKFLFYSDGIVENSIKDSEATYASKIEDDFKNSFTKEQLREKIFEQIENQEDDLTMIFIHNIDIKNSLIEKQIFKSSLEELERANEWFETLCDETCHKNSENCRADIVFTELMMNAYEHGNLGLSARKKHQLLEEDIYYETLLEMEKGCEKSIHVEVYKLTQEHSTYVITQIIDEGDGFDTQILSSIFRNARMFNGRGVFVSRKNSMGIYYNKKGNKVIFLNKI